MEEDRAERWQLGSGIWYRDRKSETWRLATTRDGTVVSNRLPMSDVARMIGAMRDARKGQWFPPDFTYSPESGSALHFQVSRIDSAWVPPHGAALSDLTRPARGGLKQTSLPLTLAASDRQAHHALREEATLPPLPAGRYRFLVHGFDTACATLMAMELERGKVLVLLPASSAWMELEHPSRQPLAECTMNHRGWRMEVVEDAAGTTLYLPTASGLAAVTPRLFSLSYDVQYSGGGKAQGGPIGWAGKVWLPVLGEDGSVNIVAKPAGATPATVLSSVAAAPGKGFEAPVFDASQAIWPSDEGQLVLRTGPDGAKGTDWIAWPDGVKPAFSLSSPYLSPAGSFSQLCDAGQDGAFEYVQMGTRNPERVRVDGPRLGTGSVSYRNLQRIEGDPWKEPEPDADKGSSEVLLPLIESQVRHGVVGVRVNAPRGVTALLESEETTDAVLQYQEDNHPAVSFGSLRVAKPWLASVFIYDARLWIYHWDLPQPLGWKLEG